MSFVGKDTENRVAEALGLSRSEVRSARKNLVQGKDWEFVDRVVTYSERGIENLMVAIGLKGGSVLPEKTEQDDAGEAAEKKTAHGVDPVVASEPGVIVCGVVRLCPNPTWVDAAFEENGKTRVIQVRVANNRFMRRGMVMKVVKHPGPLGEKGRWLMIGGKKCH